MIQIIHSGNGRGKHENSRVIASYIPEKSNPKEIVNPVTVTATNMSDAISPNE